MDGRGGCCIARYDGGGGAYDLSKVQLIMSRFRPIAPKPAAVSGGTAPENSDVYVKTKRGKRRYVRDNSKRRFSCSSRRRIGRKASPDNKTNSSAVSVSGVDTEVVTLSLLPETPEQKDSPATGGKTPIWLSFDNRSEVAIDDNLGLNVAPVMMPQAVRLVGSCVTVECVTDMWADGGGLGRTDKERMINLEGDACPGFVSDGCNRVRWTNRAYREMVGELGDEEMMVWLVMKEEVTLPVTCEAFTCRVRVTCRKEEKGLTLPCDVWRMGGHGHGLGHGGGFAWRLDVKAALSLGRR